MAKEYAYVEHAVGGGLILVRVIARAEGYAMVRRNGSRGLPFAVRERELMPVGRLK